MAWTREDAAHLLRRAGFGGSNAEVDNLFALGQAGAINRIVNYESIADPAWSSANPLNIPADFWDTTRTNLTWLLVRSPRPLEAKLVWFWHGHFTTPIGVAEAATFRKQMDKWRQYASGNFRDFLIAMYKDAAMLRYLNGAFSRKERPNENFARESMELYTTGTGPYRETDVREAARALTGWEVSWPAEVVSFNTRAFDAGPKTILGRTGNFGGDDFMNILFERPETARRICMKLYRTFVSERINLIEVNNLVATWNRTSGNIKAVLTTLFNSAAFWDPRNRGTIVKSALDFTTGLTQRLGFAMNFDRVRGIMDAMERAGQTAFAPPNPAGYATGLRLTGASMLLARYEFAYNLIYNTDQARVLSTLAGGITLPVAPATLIATLAQRLGVPSVTATTAAGIADYLGTAAIDSTRFNTRALGTLYLLASSPEYQVA